MKSSSLVLRLQSQALDSAVPVSRLLILAKVIAAKLNLTDATAWIDEELTGYMNKEHDQLPAYRQIRGEWHGQRLSGGWEPIHFETVELERKCCRAPIGIPITELEDALKGGDADGTLAFSGSTGVRTTLVRTYQLRDAKLLLQPYQMRGILDQVRTLVLNWTLQLEQADVLGEGIIFSVTEKQEAQAVAPQIFIQNAGVVGSVMGGSVINNQAANIGINARDLAKMISEARRYLGICHLIHAHRSRRFWTILNRKPTAPRQVGCNNY